MDRYIVVSQEEWHRAVAGDEHHGIGLERRVLLPMIDASKAANGLATRRQESFYVIKMVPVSLHRATVDVHVDQL